MGRLGVWVRFQSAWRTVPAYRDFVRLHMTGDPADTLHLGGIPATDKTNYVKVFSLSQRCERGQLPRHGLVIDESSGTGGAPTNWVRGARERAANARSLRRGLTWRLGSEPLFVINAFALGPWATGINLTLSLSSWCQIKSLGPDLAKIGNTLRAFGPAHHFVIMGYPPFLKQLVDHLDLDWRQYNVSMIFGGEGMPESMRAYLLDRGIKRVYGSYGASDLELNIGAETDLTIGLRRMLAERPSLAARLLQHRGSVPMIFQFNPADFFAESTNDGELEFTVCRPGYAAPKVRYNIHDLGHVMRFPELRRHLSDEGIDLGTLDTAPLDLPLLFLYGRSDASVAFYGCKIPPADVQEALFRLPELARQVDAFRLHTFDDSQGDKRLIVLLEVAPDALAQGPAAWTAKVFDALAGVNQDFRESRRMVPTGKEPQLEFHEPGTGPFAGADIRIKRQYTSGDR